MEPGTSNKFLRCERHKETREPDIKKVLAALGDTGCANYSISKEL